MENTVKNLSGIVDSTNNLEIQKLCQAWHYISNTSWILFCGSLKTTIVDTQSKIPGGIWLCPLSL